MTRGPLVDFVLELAAMDTPNLSILGDEDVRELLEKIVRAANRLAVEQYLDQIPHEGDEEDDEDEDVLLGLAEPEIHVEKIGDFVLEDGTRIPAYTVELEAESEEPPPFDPDPDLIGRIEKGQK